MAHQAWVRQCHHVLDVNSTGLAAAERHLHEMSGPRLDSERAFRAAKDDLSLCRHKLRCFDEEQARNSQVQVALRESMLHLREILATQSHVESVARQANLKQTKRLWDELLAFQSTCFASAFEDASQLEAQMDRMVVERALLSSHVDRAEDLVTAKEAAWKSALWAHLCATIRVQKWQTSLYSLLHVVVELETKRQRALDLDLYVHADAVKGDATQFVDSALIESSMLRLELQKQSRLTQYSFNRVRVLERLARQETELLQICLDEAARKTRLNNALVDRCRFLDRTLAQLRAMAAGSTAHTADKVYRALDQVMHTALDASWRRCHIQTAAFAEENWLVQHRKNVVLALESMLATAVESHNENKATLAILQRAQADQVAACALAPSPDVKPLDATHLMLILNARASATWSRQANLKRTILHEAMHLKRADKLEWFKVDPQCPEYAAARVAYLAAEGDLIANRVEIQRADHDAGESHRQCQQYVLASAVDKVATFATLNPDPALFDVRAMQTWGRFPSLCADARGALELQLRRVALSWDLRAPNVDCHEAIWGGDLKSKDVVHIYGRPHRFTTDAFAARVRAVVAAISTAKYIRRFLAHKAAIRCKNDVYASATLRLCDVELLVAVRAMPPSQLTHAALMHTVMPYLEPSRNKRGTDTMVLARALVCSSLDWTPPRLVRWVVSVVRNQALLRSLVGVLDTPCSGRMHLHTQLVAPYLEQHHLPWPIDRDTIRVEQRPIASSSPVIQVSWQLPATANVSDGVVALHWGRWSPTSNVWLWETAVCASTAHRYTLPSMRPCDSVCVGRVVIVAASHRPSPISDVFFIE
ncbi:hypothetical protein H310_08799 [Aphanomyces invadans]|uniref:Uncharacterized protein n=1 Tax=Aphanomyces invadans TaxID=157072 RepID=A0A024TXF3_9STRA|nr:hypothetical protein H310_08799 [Aphanomyces invadans]ETV98703.1 hypothetical protein H310_08799 [Aphanomyces invadans]|eukprot:XP_008872900.1 hypothetical protein H310_08799 [Aphanomyces invadans]